jgi:hypothetical protein
MKTGVEGGEAKLERKGGSKEKCFFMVRETDRIFLQKQLKELIHSMIKVIGYIKQFSSLKVRE